LLAQLTPTQIALIVGILVLAGLTKGILGVGLPLVAVPLLAQVVPVSLAIMTLAVSTVVSNGYQALQGGQLGPVFRRFWTAFVPLVVALFFGARLLVDLDERKLAFILGTVLIVFTLLGRSPKVFQGTVRHEKLMSPLVGLIAGLLGGVSSFFGPPLIMYLVALKLPKDFFISAVSTALFLGALPLIVSLIFLGAMGRDEFILSALSVIPVFVGLLIGQAIQRRMPQEAFRKGLLIILLLTGASLILRAILH
jgi:uncharacterized protein